MCIHLEPELRIQQFLVEIGPRDKVVEHLKNWGDSCREMPVGLTIQEKCKF